MHRGYVLLGGTSRSGTPDPTRAERLDCRAEVPEQRARIHGRYNPQALTMINCEPLTAACVTAFLIALFASGPTAASANLNLPLRSVSSSSVIPP